MKTRLLIAVFVISGIATAQNIWIQKAPMGAATRLGAAGFSIGTKGYVGTGYNNPLDTILNDFWEWNSATNVWTQKANFGGGYRGWTIGTSSGAKGYMGFGGDLARNYGDFWEYDTTLDSWIELAPIAGVFGAEVCFSIGSKVYVLGRAHAFWEFDRNINDWTEKASYPGCGQYSQVGFSIGNKGYVGTGGTGSTTTTFCNDFWEYDPASDNWTQKADFGGLPRFSAVGFSIGARGYIGTGSAGQGAGSNLYKDFWAYNPASDVWTRKANFGGTARSIAVGFVIGGKGYIGMGWDASLARNRNDLWEYTPDTITNTGFEEIAVENAISVYPNPFSNETTLYADIVLKDATLTLYNTLGLQVKQIKNISGQSIQLQRDNLPAGLYFIRLTQDNKVFTTDKGLFVIDK